MASPSPLSSALPRIVASADLHSNAYADPWNCHRTTEILCAIAKNNAVSAIAAHASKPCGTPIVLGCRSSVRSLRKPSPRTSSPLPCIRWSRGLIHKAGRSRVVSGLTSPSGAGPRDSTDASGCADRPLRRAMQLRPDGRQPQIRATTIEPGFSGTE